MVIWSILLPFRILYDHLVYFVVIWVHFSRFGMLYQEKSGNPANKSQNKTSSSRTKAPKDSPNDNFLQRLIYFTNNGRRGGGIKHLFET
jgi:hypothetical protein